MTCVNFIKSVRLKVVFGFMGIYSISINYTKIIILKLKDITPLNKVIKNTALVIQTPTKTIETPR